MLRTVTMMGITVMAIMVTLLPQHAEGGTLSVYVYRDRVPEENMYVTFRVLGRPSSVRSNSVRQSWNNNLVTWGQWLSFPETDIPPQGVLQATVLDASNNQPLFSGVQPFSFSGCSRSRMEDQKIRSQNNNYFVEFDIRYDPSTSCPQQQDGHNVATVPDDCRDLGSEEDSENTWCSCPENTALIGQCSEDPLPCELPCDGNDCPSGTNGTSGGGYCGCTRTATELVPGTESPVISCTVPDLCQVPSEDCGDTSCVHINGKCRLRCDECEDHVSCFTPTEAMKEDTDRQCFCEIGYVPDTDAKSCVPVYACASDPSPCGAEHKCIDTGPGRFQCLCTSTACEEVVNCGDHSMYRQQSPGRAACTCDFGYFSPTSDGRNCQPNPCLHDPQEDGAASPCGAFSTCIPTNATAYDCKCDPHYFSPSGTGKGDCQINPCETEENKGACGQFSTCIPINATAYDCKCDPLYFSPSGTGKGDCQINPCMLNNGFCGVNSVCKAMSSHNRSCSCATGYFSRTGYHTDCEPDPCAAADNGGCGVNSTCEPLTPTQIQCTCEDGHFSPNSNGTACQLNLCLVDNGGCGTNSTCTPLNATHVQCSCHAGFYSDTGRACQTTTTTTSTAATRTANTSSSVPSSTAPFSSNSSGNSAGATVGAAVGGVVGVALLIVLVVLFVRQKRSGVITGFFHANGSRNNNANNNNSSRRHGGVPVPPIENPLFVPHAQPADDSPAPNVPPPRQPWMPNEDDGEHQAGVYQTSLAASSPTRHAATPGRASAASSDPPVCSHPKLFNDDTYDDASFGTGAHSSQQHQQDHSEQSMYIPMPLGAGGPSASAETVMGRSTYDVPQQPHQAYVNTSPGKYQNFSGRHREHLPPKQRRQQQQGHESQQWQGAGDSHEQRTHQQVQNAEAIPPPRPSSRGKPKSTGSESLQPPDGNAGAIPPPRPSSKGKPRSTRSESLQPPDGNVGAIPPPRPSSKGKPKLIHRESPQPPDEYAVTQGPPRRAAASRHTTASEAQQLSIYDHLANNASTNA